MVYNIENQEDLELVTADLVDLILTLSSHWSLGHGYRETLEYQSSSRFCVGLFSTDLPLLLFFGGFPRTIAFVADSAYIGQVRSINIWQ